MMPDSSVNRAPFGLRDVAEFYQLGLWAGDVSCKEVAIWVDSLLCESDAVFPWLAQLSTCRSDVYSLIEALDRVPGIAAGSLPLKMYLGRLCNRLRSGQISGHDACQKLWSLFQGEGVPDRVLELRGRQDFPVDYQRPGYFRKELTARNYCARILDVFRDYEVAG